MKRKTEMILRGIKLVSNVGKAVAIGRTVYGVVKFGIQLKKGVQATSELKAKSSKMLNVVKNIGTATEVAATATQVVSDLAVDAKSIGGKLKSTKKPAENKTNKTNINVVNGTKKKNR